jgi:hypothetical protein
VGAERRSLLGLWQSEDAEFGLEGGDSHDRQFWLRLEERQIHCTGLFSVNTTTASETVADNCSDESDV